jgi:hypothetical protein
MAMMIPTQVMMYPIAKGGLVYNKIFDGFLQTMKRREL